MGILDILFRRKKRRKKEQEAEEESTPIITPTKEEPLVIGILSGKGGCGKSLISANLATLISALYRSVIVIDTDITNATVSNILCGLCNSTFKILAQDDGVSFLDYMVEGYEKFELYLLKPPPNKPYSIQKPGKKDLGIAVKEIYLLPAKKSTLSYDRNLSALARLERDEVRSSLMEIYSGVIGFARKRGIRHIIYDFPPLRPDQPKVYDGVFYLLELIPNFIMVSTFDPSAVHGLVAILNQRYAYLKPRTRAFFINMAVKDEQVKASIKQYIEKIYGRGTVFFIRKDPRWGWSLLPTIVLGDPSKGAHRDLIYAVVKLGIIEREVVKKHLGFDPLE